MNDPYLPKLKRLSGIYCYTIKQLYLKIKGKNVMSKTIKETKYIHLSSLHVIANPYLAWVSGLFYSCSPNLPFTFSYPIYKGTS